MTNFKDTTLWQGAFQQSRSDAGVKEQEFFRVNLDAMRDRVIPIVDRVMRDMPGYTVHDITHLDALWETASLLAPHGSILNPPEAFVFGGAVLLHDAAMTLAAYPDGIDELRQTNLWLDAVALHCGENPIEHQESEILCDVLRLLHAPTAERLALQCWEEPNHRGSRSSEKYYLIENGDLRQFYGRTIGQIAHSHWWPIGKVERELCKILGGMPPHTLNEVDLLKIAALLRVADAIHLDRRRAPPFVRALDRPRGVSDFHWKFQGSLAFPRVVDDALQFTSGQACPIEDADSWWLGFDALSLADRELRDTDLLLRDTNRLGLRARRVKGVTSAIDLAVDIPVSGWKPVNSQLHVSDLPSVVQSLGGSNLYANDSRVPLRELLQNGVDAILARRSMLGSSNWGSITVSLNERVDGIWLEVVDDGVGMSERVLTTHLLDFGATFWRSPAIMEEFPGLAHRKSDFVGRFGVGFFSVFMLGDVVRVTTRRYDSGQKEALRLEFTKGLASRPILSDAIGNSVPINGGTKVEVKLFHDPRDEGYFDFKLGNRKEAPLATSAKLDAGNRANSLTEMVSQIAPTCEVTINVQYQDKQETAIVAGDWLSAPPKSIAGRFRNSRYTRIPMDAVKNMRTIVEGDGRIVGRASLLPSISAERVGSITSGGFRVQAIPHILGAVVGEVDNVARNAGSLGVSKEALREWAKKQVKLVSRSNYPDDFKSLCAEIVLECGAPVGALPIVRRDQQWIGKSDLRKIFKELEEISVHIGDIDYNDEDEVSLSAFEEDFVEDKSVFIIPTLSTSLLSTGFGSIFGTGSRQSRLSIQFESLVSSAWAAKQQKSFDVRTVGEVGFDEIIRTVVVYKR